MTDGRSTKESFKIGFTFGGPDPERTRSEWGKARAGLTEFLECRGWSSYKAETLAQTAVRNAMDDFGYLAAGSPRAVSGQIEFSFDWEELGYPDRSRPKPVPIEEQPITTNGQRPPSYAEYVLYLLVPKEEREALTGDLQEGYGLVLERFNKRCADVWYCKQVAGSVLPLLRRALLRIGALVWLGQILRRLVS